MTLNEYQKLAMATAIYQHREYPFLALAEEQGEVMGKLAKYVRKQQTSLPFALGAAYAKVGEAGEQLHDDLVAELGDVLWQVQACANELGVSLEELARANLYKLTGRKERGTLEGSGDER